MYRNCIFCSADLGSNDSVERFPVGGTLAFDGEKGRLWTVCPQCARWNLAPLAERWDAIEDAERLFRDTRQRVQSENVGIARLRDGTRLIRVGNALAGELAVWRYGESLLRRRWRHALWAGAGVAAAGAVVGAGLVVGAVGIGVATLIGSGAGSIIDRRTETRIVSRLPAGRGEMSGHVLRWRQLRRASVEISRGDVVVRIPRLVPRTFATPDDWRERMVGGADAMHLLARAMPMVNAAGARRTVLNEAVRVLEATSPREYIEECARGRFVLNASRRPAAERLAFEMALNEESERRAMEGELAALEAMWREAEQIAAIADALPDLPASDPPRLRP